MLCQAAREELAALLDGELASESAALVLAHLEGCAPCRAERDALERTRARVRALPRVAAPAGLLVAVGARVERMTSVASTCGGLDAGDLSAFLDVELEEPERERVAKHLEECPSCRGDLVALDSVVGGVQALPRIPAPPSLLTIVRERIAALAQEVKSSRRSAARASSRLGRTPSARRVAPPPVTATAPTASPASPAAPRAPREPIQIPTPVRRFLAAASVLVLAWASLGIATVNVSTRPPFSGWAMAKTAPSNLGQPGGRSFEPKLPALRKPLEAERTLVVLADLAVLHVASLDQAGQLARAELQGGGASVEATSNANAFVVQGGSPDLRARFATLPHGLALEDAAALDAVLPPPLDRVFGRNGEVYAGQISSQGPGGVSLVAGSLAIDLPRRAVVRVERASNAPVEVGLSLRLKTEARDE